MKTKLIAIGISACALAFAQSTPETGLRITAQTLSKNTSQAVFGPLPKAVSSAAVQVCNQTSGAITVPQERIIQQVKMSQGVTLLPQSAAIAVVSDQTGKSTWNTSKRYGTAIENSIADLVTMGVIHANAVWGAALVSAASVFGVGVKNFDPAVYTHTYITLASAMLPNPIQLQPLGCAAGYALLEGDPAAKTFDFSMPLAN